MLVSRDDLIQRECAADEFYVLMSLKEIHFVESVDGAVEWKVATYRPTP